MDDDPEGANGEFDVELGVWVGEKTVLALPLALEFKKSAGSNGSDENSPEDSVSHLYTPRCHEP